MIMTLKRDWLIIQVLFFCLSVGIGHASPSSRQLNVKTLKVLKHLRGQGDFSKELKLAALLSTHEQKDFEKVWSSPAYSWEWRWFSAMFMAQDLTAGRREKLIEGLHDPLFIIRLASLTALKSKQDAFLQPHFSGLLKDASLLVRKATVDSMKENSSLMDLEALEKALLDEKNSDHLGGDLMGIKRSILEAIAKRKERQSIHVLAAFLSSKPKDMTVEYMACKSIESIALNYFRDVEKAETQGCSAKVLSWYKKNKQKI